MFKPKNNSSRFKKKISSYYTNKKKFNRLSIGINSYSGTNESNKKTIFTKNKGKKKSFFKVDFFRKIFNKIAICLSLKKISYINSFICLIKYSNGIFSYILSSHGFKPGDYCYTTINPPRFSLKYNLNCNIILKYLNPNNIFYNVEIHVNQGSVYSRSAGTFCKMISININKKIAKITLPTGKKKIISIYCLVTLGRASNIYFNKQFLSKAGYNIKLGKKPSVRGVAMNPVDHPHGGRTKTNSPELTP